MDDAYGTLIGAQKKLKYGTLINLKPLADGELKISVEQLARATSTDERKAKMVEVFQKFSAVARKLFAFEGTEDQNTLFGKWKAGTDPAQAVDSNLRRKASTEHDQVTIRRFMDEFLEAELKLTTDTGRDGRTC